MGCGNSQDPNRVKSLAIDEELHKYRASLNREVKILLLGPGESGKSTVFKQMKIVSEGGGFTQEELLGFRHIVHANCISQMRVIVQACARTRTAFANQTTFNYAAQLLQLPPQGTVWTPEIGMMIKALWHDPGIRAMYSQAGALYQLNDSAAYFFDGLDRFIQPDYCPTVDDVLRVRVRSTGIEEAQFNFDKNVFRVMDVGGQRSERKKWAFCFNGVHCVLYCASLSCYDQVLREDKDTNRMHEALNLFGEMAGSVHFHEKTLFILFLNKTDLFMEKLQRGVDLAMLFPGYTGGLDFENASTFIQNRFLELYHGDPARLVVHRTCAVDTNQIRVVISTVRAHLLKMLFEADILNTT